MPSPKTPPKAPAILAAVALVAPIVAVQEGYVAKARPDPVGLETVCFGERVALSDLDSGKIYSRSECMGRLRERLAAEYAPAILKCLPQFTAPKRKAVFAAFIDAAWNAGPGNVCKSPMAANVRAGKWKAACDAFVGWHVAPHGKLLGGLVKRRRDVERPLCLQGIA